MEPSLYDLTSRSLQAELMDAPLASPQEYDRIIRQIESVNALTGGYRPVLQWLEKQIPQQAVTIVDLGCGRGSLLRRLAKHFHGARVRLIGIDNNPCAIKAAREATPEEGVLIEYCLADIFSLDAQPAADFILCSHVTHHMSDEEIIKLLNLLDRKAKRGWFICDLHRHRMAYLFAKGILALLPVDAMVKHDGPLSVCRAFARGDWQKLVAEAGVSSAVQIKWYFPFRYGLTCKKGFHEKI